MDFIDLRSQQAAVRDEIESNIRAVLDHGRYIMGPEVGRLEAELASFVGVKHAVGCGSGTDALLMALMAHNVGPGDAVFTTPFTFIATAEMIRLLGAVPVFVDIDPVTFNMDPGNLDRAIRAVKGNDSSGYPLPLPLRPRHAAPGAKFLPKGIIAVDLFGLPADYDEINGIAADHGLFVIEDAAQSLGAAYRGKKAGALSAVGCTSFFPAKPLGCYGDGGMCFTDDGALAERMKSIRIHGQGKDKYENIRIGINARLDTIQAAVLLAKFGIFPREIELRQKVAERYNHLLNGTASGLVTPRIPGHSRSVFAQYSILARDTSHRRALQDRLKKEDIPTAVYYPKPLHRQEAFRDLRHQAGDFPVSEACAARIFSLPMHPYLAEADQERIASLLAGRS